MSEVTDELRGLVVQVGREAISWAVEKLRGKAKEAGIVVDDHAIEAMLLAELTALDITMRALSRSVSADIDKLEISERAFRESPNVTVVDSLDDDTEDK